MSKGVRRFLTILLRLLLVLVIGLVLTAVFLVRRSFPKVRGELSMSGLDGPVDIYRDPFGIPHIYASTQHDLFFAQGYVHAQDRFWQMDVWRHIGSGRLSEMFGEDQLETDQFLRTLGWARVVQVELDGMDEQSLSILQSYADGVNAYLADHQGSTLSLEYAILKLNNPDYRPEPWQPLHSLTWAKVMAWDLGGNMTTETTMAVLLKTLTPEQVSEIFPEYPSDHPLIVPDFKLSSSTQDSTASAESLRDYSVGFEALSRRVRALDGMLGGGSPEIGSNNWVISGKLTSTGKPLLANDPHLNPQIPSIWYEVSLHCVPKGPGCNFDVAGFSFAGAPGVIIGHNDRIAWGFTNVDPDVQDLYIEKINPENPNQYEVNGGWVDMVTVNETLLVAGGDPLPLTVRYTRHGPLIWSEEALNEFRDKAGLDIPESYALALRWTALEPSRTFAAVWKMDQAQNWSEFQQAAREFDVPSQNFVYADVDGNIGYQMPGKIPLRTGGAGNLPVPGWNDDHEWAGYIPFEQLPYAFNPSQGYIATANNRVVGLDYPYQITTEWDYGYRAERIVELIESAPGPIDISYIQKIQGDNKNLIAELLVPVLNQIQLDDGRLENARQLFEGWDYQQPMDSAQAALFGAFWKYLLADTFNDDLPEEYWPEGDSRWFEVMRNLVEEPNSLWWDIRYTPQEEVRDQIFRQAFGQAVDELEGNFGGNKGWWKWGDIHRLTLTNQTLGKSGIGLIESLFNRGPFPTSGGTSLINNTGWNASLSEESDFHPYDVAVVPSMRMIVDLSDFQSSLAVNLTGQSGHAYHPHYYDMTDLWRNIQYHSMLWAPAPYKDHLRLVP